MRRRVASVNQRWDNQVAVLLGDFLYARAFSLSTELSSRLCSQLLSERLLAAHDMAGHKIENGRLPIGFHIYTTICINIHNRPDVKHSPRPTI